MWECCGFKNSKNLSASDSQLYHQDMVYIKLIHIAERD